MRDKSDSTWSDGCAILGQNLCNSAANRFYYAVFQAIYAFARDRNLIAQDDKIGLHGQARRLVASHGKQAARYKIVFDRLLELRTRADYTPENIDITELDENLINDANNLRQYFSRVLK